MNRGLVAVVLSVAAHAIAVGVVQALPPSPPPIAAPQQPAIVEIVELVTEPVTEPALVDVVLMDAAALASIEAPAVAPRAVEAPRMAAIATSASDVPRSGPPPISSSSLAAAGHAITGLDGIADRRGPPQPRDPNAPLPGVPGNFVDGFLAGSRPLEGPTPESGRIVQNGRQLSVPDLQVPATIGDDGRVAFHDKGDFEIHFALPSGTQLGDDLANWYRDPYAQTRARAVQEMAPHEQAVPGGWDAGAGGDTSPTGETSQPSAPQGGPTIPIFAGTFDLTAWAMRRAGMDPYSARKRKLLADTFSERAAIGARHTERQLVRTGEIMLRNIAMAKTVRDPVARRAALFELWDECEQGEGRTAEAGDRARAMILGHVRAHEVYPAAELAALNARRASEQPFAP